MKYLTENAIIITNTGKTGYQYLRVILSNKKLMIRYRESALPMRNKRKRDSGSLQRRINLMAVIASAEPRRIENTTVTTSDVSV